MAGTKARKSNAVCRNALTAFLKKKPGWKAPSGLAKKAKAIVGRR
jgi:hypothetical protein